MESADTRNLRNGFWATSLGTLGSRVLGVVRDMAMAGLLGLAAGGVMDSFVVALRVPNLFRRVFGEGALAASFLPVFTAEHQQDPRRAWRLASTLLVWLAVALSLLTLAGEAVCLAVMRWADDASLVQLASLTAAMLPYLIFICLAAQASAMLQALLEFRWPALVPALLNLCWLVAAWCIAPRFAPDKLAQAYVIAGAVLVSGVLQLAVQIPLLVRLGFRFEFDWSQSSAACWRVARTMGPIALGLAVTQLNTLADSLIAWGLSAPAGASRSIAWLGHAVDYPLESGAASAIYYGERFYQLPVGVLGVAIATVIYPLLARHAARGQRQSLSAELSRGLRLAWFTALPASVGIMLVARPATKLLLERGAFSAHDTERAAGMIVCYAVGIVAYCAIPLLVRGHYAAGNHAVPARIAVATVGCDLLLNLSLVWPCGERGLAISTALTAAIQVALLLSAFAGTVASLAWRELCVTAAKSSVAVTVMAIVVLASSFGLGTGGDVSRAQQALGLSLTIALGAAAYLTVCRKLGMSEVALLLTGGGQVDRRSKALAAKSLPARS